MTPRNGTATAANGGGIAQIDELLNYRNSTGIATLPDGTTLDISEVGAGSDNARYEVFLLGFMHGRESLTAELERLRYERDLWYFCHTNRKSPADFYRHQTDALWEAGAA